MNFLKPKVSLLINLKWQVLGILVLLVIGFFYHNKIFSIHFIDEEDNFVLGHYLLEGKKLYSDLFSHHQPMGYVISAGFQFIEKPENIDLLVKRHREFMIAWSFFWCALLILRFKNKVILPLIIFEVSKFYLLGNLFLSESLAVYPILYLMLLIINYRTQIKTAEYFLAGLLIGLSAMLLAPAWPLLFAYLLLFTWLKKIKPKQLIILGVGGLIPILISLPFVDPYYYFHNVFYINYKYYIPQSGEEKFPWSLLKAAISPLSVFGSHVGYSGSGLILKTIGVMFLISAGFLIFKKNFRLLGMILILLALSNIRYFTPGLQYYTGFHLLIWYAVFILISFYFLTDFISNIKSKMPKVLLISFLLGAFSIIVFSSKDLFQKNDIAHDFYVNYSEQFTYGEVIKAMKNPGDTLFVVPDEWLLYYQSGIENNNKMVNFYGWMSLVWELNGYVVDAFKINPPTFFYCDCSEDYVYSYSPDYYQMIRDGGKTKLWIRNDKFKNLTEDQKAKIRFFHFQAE